MNMCMFEYVISYCIILIISKITVFCETNKYKIYNSKIKKKYCIFFEKIHCLKTASSGFKRFLPSINSSCFEIVPSGLERFQAIYKSLFINSAGRFGAVQNYLYCQDYSGLIGTNWD